jgi:hypothetical protein
MSARCSMLGEPDRASNRMGAPRHLIQTAGEAIKTLSLMHKLKLAPSLEG